eukprot:s45_g6.t1
MDFQDQGVGSVSYQQQVNQVWVAPSPDPELVNQAAGVVLQAQTEAHHAKAEAQQTRTEAERAIRETQVSAEMHVQQLENQTRRALEEAQSRATKEVTQVHSQASQEIAALKLSASQAIYNQDKQLRSDFRAREESLLKQVQDLSRQLAESQNQFARDQMRLNGTELEQKVDQLVEKMSTFEIMLNDMNQRLVALETWEEEEQIGDFDPEEELIPVVRSPPKVQSPKRATVPRVVRDDDDDEGDAQANVNLEDTCLRWKDVSSVRMPPLPDSAGGFRSWKNAFLPLLIALDSSDESHLYQWLLQAFNARSPQDTTLLQQDSGGFPRFDRILCSWFTKDTCLKGYFGTRIQAFIEESIARGMNLRGRPLLKFDLDAALGGMVSAVELFQIPSPDSDIQSLINFRDKVRYVLGGSFALEWALDSGAGEDLSSVGAFANQGVPQEWVEGFSTVSSSPLTFETGGGAKAATNTVGYIGDKAGEGMAYMLKSCPYVRSLGKLIQKGFSFFWGPEHEPTLVPPDVPFNVSCEKSQCFTAERVEHCVPILKEQISFTYGMPAASVEPDSVDPRLREDGVGTEDQRLRGSDPIEVVTSSAKLPVDHLLTHQPASKFCDVCRQAKLRVRAHKRFGNQSASIQEARTIESPTEFLQRICVDHLESTEESLSGDSYALICVDKFSGVIGAYPSKSKAQSAVEQGLCHFCREKLPVVESDRYPSILAAVRDLKMHSDPSPPNDPIHNSHVESAINIFRQGTRSLLLQSGLHVGHWPSAMRCFGYQYNLTTLPIVDSDSMRHAAHQYHQALPEGEEGPIAPIPHYESKLHMALQYQPEPRTIPYGALVWYLGKSREPNAPKTFGPNGRPALYIGPEILPGLRCKDIHVLLDLQELTSHDHVREIRTRDFIAPAGTWAFPLSKGFGFRGGIDVDVAHEEPQDSEPPNKFPSNTLFDTIDYEEDVPVCPPRSPEELPERPESEGDPGEYTQVAWLQPRNLFGKTFKER